ncbi:MAG: hypothetical protein WBO46_21025 [Caldilineaceae bacterium]
MWQTQPTFVGQILGKMPYFTPFRPNGHEQSPVSSPVNRPVDVILCPVAMEGMGLISGKNLFLTSVYFCSTVVLPNLFCACSHWGKAKELGRSKKINPRSGDNFPERLELFQINLGNLFVGKALSIRTGLAEKRCRLA